MAGCSLFPNFASLTHSARKCLCNSLYDALLCVAATSARRLKLKERSCLVFTPAEQKHWENEREREREKELMMLMKEKLDSRLKCISLTSTWMAGLHTRYCTVCDNLNSPQSLFGQPIVHSPSHGFFSPLAYKQKSLHCEPSPLTLW